jgi:hypothetical protein
MKLAVIAAPRIMYGVLIPLVLETVYCGYCLQIKLNHDVKVFASSILVILSSSLAPYGIEFNQSSNDALPP